MRGQDEPFATTSVRTNIHSVEIACTCIGRQQRLVDERRKEGRGEERRTGEGNGGMGTGGGEQGKGRSGRGGGGGRGRDIHTCRGKG